MREIDNLMRNNSQAITTLAKCLKRAGTKYDPTGRKQKAALARLDGFVARSMRNLHQERGRINRARAPELRFNWDEAAVSAEPTESIHISEAPMAPKNVREAITGRYAKYFLRAMQNEMESLTNKEVWKEVPKPDGRRVIRSKWVYSYKTDPEGFIKKFKARLVAVGCSQIANQDYTETHSPVVKLKTLRILLAMSALFGLDIGQIDVDTAYLNGDLSEPNYMEMPKGFERSDSNGNPLVAKLQKALYGLHQSGREWYFTLRKFLLSQGFSEFKSEPCAYAKIDPDTKQFIFVFVYVDDILICSPDKGAIERTKQVIRSRFDIKDLGNAEWVLKVQIKKLSGGLFLCQETYLIETLKSFDMWDIPESKFKDTPMAVNWEHDDQSPLLSDKQNSEYATLIAKIIYLSQLTRPDVLYTVNTLAQFQRPARECNWKAAMRMLQYLRKTYDWGLYYQSASRGDVMIFRSDSSASREEGFPGRQFPEGYGPALATDASYGQEHDRKSRSAYAFIVFGCLVSWYSKKQPTTALSSTEAELNALVEGIKEAEWMRMFLQELGFIIDKPIVSSQDNQSVIAIAENPIHHARIKHMEIKTHYVREKIEDKLVKLVYCPTELMIADVFTKPLPPQQHNRLCELMGIRSIGELESGRANKVHLVARY
jgi:hypothetical protein